MAKGRTLRFAVSGALLALPVSACGKKAEEGTSQPEAIAAEAPAAGAAANEDHDEEADERARRALGIPEDPAANPSAEMEDPAANPSAETEDPAANPSAEMEDPSTNPSASGPDRRVDPFAGLRDQPPVGRIEVEVHPAPPTGNPK